MRRSHEALPGAVSTALRCRGRRYPTGHQRTAYPVTLMGHDVTQGLKRWERDDT